MGAWSARLLGCCWASGLCPAYSMPGVSCSRFTGLIALTPSVGQACTKWMWSRLLAVANDCPQPQTPPWSASAQGPAWQSPACNHNDRPVHSGSGLCGQLAAAHLAAGGYRFTTPVSDPAARRRLLGAHARAVLRRAPSSCRLCRQRCVRRSQVCTMPPVPAAAPRRSLVEWVQPFGEGQCRGGA